MSGGLAGGFGAAIANPCDLIKTRSQAAEGNFQKVSWHFKDIYKNHGGLPGFWRGTKPGVIRAFIMNSSSLATYDATKHKLIDNGLAQDGLPL